MIWTILHTTKISHRAIINLICIQIKIDFVYIADIFSLYLVYGQPYLVVKWQEIYNKTEMVVLVSDMNTGNIDEKRFDFEPWTVV